jgi:hypothetical protein
MNKLRRQVRGKIGLPPLRVAVQTHLPWYWKWGAAAVAVALITGLVWWMFDAGQKLAGFDKNAAQKQLTELTETREELTKENTRLKSTAAELEQQAQIDKAAQAELTKSYTQVQEENANLKEDLTFFRSIMSTAASPDGLSVYNFKLEPDSVTDEYRYRMMLMQGGQRENDFKGRVQLVVNVIHNGAQESVVLPEADKDKTPGFDVNFKFYQRVEGRFKLAQGVKIKSVQVRVVELPSGQVKLARNFNLT